MNELYCPHCEYNLTGLIEKRCPECGHPFDAVEIGLLAHAAPTSISLVAVGVHLLWPALIYNLLVPLSFWANLEFLIGTLGITFLVFAFVNALSMTLRLFARWAANSQRPPFARATLSVVVGGTVGLLIAQFVLAMGGCYVIRKIW